jgi:hypothetical protein
MFMNLKQVRVREATELSFMMEVVIIDLAADPPHSRSENTGSVQGRVRASKSGRHGLKTNGQECPGGLHAAARTDEPLTAAVESCRGKY